MRRWLGWAALATLAACGGAAGTLGQTSDPDAGSLDGASSGDGSALADGNGSDSASGGGDGGLDDDSAVDGASDDGAVVSDSAAGDSGLGSDGAGPDASAGDARLDAPSDARVDAPGDARADGADASADSGIGPCGVGVVNGIVEVEPNGTLATATPMPAALATAIGGTRSICGTATSAADLDFVRFQIPGNSSGLNWEWSGAVAPTFYVNGVATPVVTLQSAFPYVVEIKPLVGATFPLAWRFTAVQN